MLHKNRLGMFQIYRHFLKLVIFIKMFIIDIRISFKIREWEVIEYNQEGV